MGVVWELSGGGGWVSLLQTLSLRSAAAVAASAMHNRVRCSF